MSLTQSSAFKEIVESRDQARAIQLVQDLIQKKAYEIDSVKAIIELADFGLFPKEIAKDILSFSSQVFYKYPGRAEPTLLCLMCLYLLERDEEIFALCENILTSGQTLDILLALRQFTQFNYSKKFFERILTDTPPHFNPGLNNISLKPDVVLNFSCDGIYFRNKFLKFHSGTVMEAARIGALVFITLIDPLENDIADCEKLAGIGNFAYQVIDSKFWLQKVKAWPQSEIEVLSQQKSVYACMRFMITHELINLFNCPVVNLDADLIIKTPLREYVNSTLRRCLNSDIALQFTSRSLPGADHHAHEVVVNCSEAGRDFARLLSMYISFYFRESLGLWTLDQCALNACLRYSPATEQIAIKRVENLGDEHPTETLTFHFGGGFGHILPISLRLPNDDSKTYSEVTFFK